MKAGNLRIHVSALIVLLAGGLVAASLTNLGAARARPEEPVTVAAVKVRPGPDLLYASPARAPQLQNTGYWKAEPLLVSGASGYRSNEFLYQDHLYDDLGAGRTAYPADAARYAGNAADLVEVRYRSFPHVLAIRLTYSSMVDPEVMATTIALGTGDGRARPLPHGGAAAMPADLFLTWHGTTTDAVRASTGHTAHAALPTTVDELRRQVTIEVPTDLFQAAPVLRTSVAAGLWDPLRGRYLQPAGGGGCPFFNVAFRPAETGVWSSDRQAAALEGCDVGAFAASIELAKLAGPDDLLLDQPGGVPTSGRMTRIFASRFEQGQGRSGNDAITCAQPCPEAPMFVGRLQPYTVIVPSGSPPVGGFGLTLSLHACGGNMNTGPEIGSALADRGDGSLVLTPNGRGPCHWYWGQAAADVFESWADLMRHHPVDLTRTVVTGISMGGYGAYKLAGQFPDLFASIVTDIACASAGIEWPGHPVAPAGGDASTVSHLVPSFRNLPILAANASEDPICFTSAVEQVRQALDDRGYRYDWRTYVGGHGPWFLTADETTSFFDRYGVIDPDPARVTFAYDERMDERRWNLNSDHAHWISGVAVRDTSSGTHTGIVDVRSHGLGEGEPGVDLPVVRKGTSGPYRYTGRRRTWTSTDPVPPADVLDVETTNVAELTIDASRARVSCTPRINLRSDGPTVVHVVNCRRP